MKSVSFIAVLIATASFSCAKKRSSNSQSGQDFIRLEKDIFAPDKHWLYKVTVIKNSHHHGFAYVGLQSQVNLGHFAFESDRLNFISSHGAKDTSTPSKHLLNSWMLSSLENNMQDAEKSNWENDSIFSIDWHSAKIEESKSFRSDIDMSCYESGHTRLAPDSLEAAIDYISFTLVVDYQMKEKCHSKDNESIAKIPYTVHYKYSFMPDLVNEFSPYVYSGPNDPLFKKFGFYAQDVSLNRNNSIENKIVMNRWDPKKKHVFYFDENFPERYKWIYNDPEKGIFPLTNKLFQEHEINIRFSTKDYDEDKEFGDIRYSFIKLSETPSHNAPLGYTSLDTHPRTGEIFASNTVLSVSKLQGYIDYIGELKDKEFLSIEHSPISREIREFTNRHPSLLSSNSQIKSSKEISSVFRMLLPRFTYAISEDAANQTEEGLFNFTSPSIMQSLSLNHPIFKTLISQVDRILEKVKKRLDKDLVNIHAHNSSDSIYQFDQAALSSLQSDKFDQAGKNKDDIKKAIIYGVAIHEFGHTLGLKHNFYGSVDGSLETVISDSSEDIHSTSVMDYLTFAQIINLGYGWQPYDENAIIYAYSDGKTAHKRYGKNIYAYCSDEHLTLNPLCNAYDSGSSPSEILYSLIQNYDASYWNQNYKVINSSLNANDYNHYAFLTMFDMKKFLKLHLDAFQSESIKKELSLISTPTIAQTISSYLKKDTAQAATLSALFFKVIIGLSSIERPYTNIIDEFTGRINYFGIFPDKFFAQMFLFGDDGFPYNSSSENNAASYLSLFSDPNYGPLTEEILRQAFVSSGPSYTGFDLIGRRLYAFNASRFLSANSSDAQKEIARVFCYTKSSFETFFDIDPDNTDGSGTSLIIGVYDGSSTDERLSNESNFAIAKIDRYYYVAGLGANPYGYDVIRSGNLAAIKQMHKDYLDARQSRSECYTK